MKKIFLCGMAFLVLLSFYVNATTINAASCSLTDVKLAIDSANSGDIVKVPAGRCTWSSNLVVTKGIMLIGAGIGNTNITSDYYATDPGWPVGQGNYLVVYAPTHPENNEPFRLSGFTFDCSAKCFWLMLEGGAYNQPVTKIRIDHNKATCTIAGRGIAIYDNIIGVIDNNELHLDTIRFYNGNEDGTWQYLPFNYGTANAFYAEDNVWISNEMLVSSGGGSRWCVRHNAIINTCASSSWGFDAHGNLNVYPNDGNANIGCEIYDNNITSTANTGMKLLDARGGKALVYDNNIISTSSPWIASTEEYHDYDNRFPIHQVSGQPQHLSDSYYFRNKWNGAYWAEGMYPYVPRSINYNTENSNQVPPGGSVVYPDPNWYHGLAPYPPYRVVPQENLDFWCEKASFDGSVGIGFGSLSARPATCTKGVGYWVPDTKTLYKCNSTNTWIAYYTPYIYPHPLTVAPFGTAICGEGVISSSCWCQGLKSTGYCCHGYYQSNACDSGSSSPPPVAVPGDLNGDRKVDISDLVIVASNFGKTSGFDVRANVVSSTPEVIDIADLSFVAKRYTG